MMLTMKKSLIVLCCVILVACSKNEKTTTPVVEDITESVYASGSLKTMNQYSVFPVVNGTIKSIHVESGDTISEGDTLFVLANDASRLNTENAQLAADFYDYSSNTSKLDELKSAIDIAKERMNNDSVQYVRQKNLWSQQVGSKSELENRELAYKNSINQYRSAILRYNDLKKQIQFNSLQSKKNLEISKKGQGDFIVRSEIKGKVYSIQKNKGEMVGPQTALAIVGDANDFIIELQVDEYDIVKIKKGQTVKITMDSYKGESFEAIVHRIDPIMNERTRTFLIEAVFTKRPSTLYPHLSLEANIVINTKQAILTIPRECLIDNEYVIKKGGEKVKVVTGLMDYRKVEILSGITEKDVIVIPEE